ncbi:MAG: L-serine ammonia-lyase, iron-sulfur-dependent, subunit alpha, partial [Gemmatimonadota bacterium]|nr:L-serine ammonia-lyase, iron-sulfur-dependent, subunit alpha [Gemmatimonadota bacterium]
GRHSRVSLAALGATHRKDCLMHRSLESLLREARESGRDVPQVVLDTESAESGIAPEQIRARIGRTLSIMRAAIDEGLKGEVRSASGLTGGRARKLAENGPRLLGPRVTTTLARAIATLEVNAAMGLIVAAPTAGAAGVLPAILISMDEFAREGEDRLIDAMLVAGGVGGVIAHRASLSGAEGGCQAETGTAAAMGAAAVAWLSGGTHEQIETAVALTLQGMLGLICDPIGGLVEIPCIYRNASAAMQAIAGAEMALAGLDFPVTADEVIDVMGEVGRRMPSAYRETAMGGLAATPSARRLVQIRPSSRPAGISQ